MKSSAVRLLTLAAATLCLVWGAAASAATIGQLDLTMTVEGQAAWDWTGTVDGAPNGTPYGYTVQDGSYSAGPGAYSIEWSAVEFDIDPFVSGNWAVVNNSGVTQIFTLSVDVPVLAVSPASLMYGSSAISVSDANGSGSSTLGTVGGAPLYSGTIDFTGALSLYGAPYSLGTGLLGTSVDNQTAGIAPGSIPGSAVVGFIGIEHRFQLSAGDRATFNSIFSVVAVPEPGTALLLGMGLVALGLRRR